MNATSKPTPLSITRPRFEGDARRIALEMCGKPVAQLQDMFGCSPKVAGQTLQRYQHFFADESEQIALRAYFGQAYKCLDAASLGDEDLSFAQSHLHITSFLYGLLRPLDGIRPYRMEGRLSFDATGGLPLFDYWKPRLTRVLIDAVKADDGILIHLATKEMERLFDWREVSDSVRIIQPQFFVEKGGRLKNVTVYSKSCRGAMTRYILQHRLLHPADLLGFEYEGFRFNESYSEADRPVFTL